MADKKDDKKDKKPAGNTAEEGFAIAIVVFLLAMGVLRIYTYFNTAGTVSTTPGGVSVSYIEMITGGQNGWYANTLHFLEGVASVYVTFATVFSLVMFLVVVYIYWLIIKMDKEDAAKDKMETVQADLPSEQSQKWQQVVMHSNSQNNAEWRLSILEADVMLDEMLDTLGYHGESMGDKLKNVDKADFKTIDLAWEAHKTRNAIAHEGADFLITQRDTKRVIGLYEQVFKEFLYI